MANTYTISLPDDVKEYADQLAQARILSEKIADFLRAEMKRKVNKDGSIKKE